MSNWACLSYSTSINLGDEIQSIAVRDQLKRYGIDLIHEIDRDTSATVDSNISCIYAGWFDGNYCSWPPRDNINPIFISFHINEEPKDASYSAIDKYLIKPSEMVSLADKSFIPYYAKYSPIYTRDLHTQRKLENSGIPATFLGCLTMTLPSPNISPEDRSGIYMVDVETDSWKHVPNDIIKKSIKLTHITSSTNSAYKFQQAQMLLNQYQKAKLVITSRLHCVLPCLAYGTPVIFLLSTWETDVRFQGLHELMSIVGRDEIDWYNHTNKNPSKFNEMRDKLNTIAGELIQKRIK